MKTAITITFMMLLFATGLFTGMIIKLDKYQEVVSTHSTRMDKIEERFDKLAEKTEAVNKSHTFLTSKEAGIFIERDMPKGLFETKQRKEKK